MPRKIIPLVTGKKYHVFNRGVDKREVFTTKPDYLRFYLSLDVFNTIEPCHNFDAAKNKQRLRSDKLVQIYAFALLPNHFHMIIGQLVDGGISEFMKRLSGGYTSYFNESNDRVGSLFQGTFKRILIDSEAYYKYLFVYVNENHFVHQIKRDKDICYSSSPHYQGIAVSRILPEINGEYNFNENIALAKEIADRREILKTEL